MKKNRITRRTFITTAAAGSLGTLASPAFSALGKTSDQGSKLAILGGKPVRKDKSWPEWPHVDDRVVESVVKTTKSGKWSRIQAPSGTVSTFEKKYAGMLGRKYAVATGSGTQALSTCVEALGIGPGDEVITSPYTDMGTVASILMSRALPVMADLDPESFQIDPDDVERKINGNTRAIMPVHIMGYPCDMERIMAMAREHDLKVIEDACQAHFAEYRGQMLGTIGDLGCFSFQASKQIPCGEGGIIVGDDEELMQECYTVQNRGADRRNNNVRTGTKYRMNEFEGAILMGQLPGVMERFRRREENARYLTSRLKEVPGIMPQKLYEGTENGAHYRYSLSYHKEQFDGADRSRFLKAVRAEGIGFSSYIRQGLHREPWVDYILDRPVYREMFSPSRLRSYRGELDCPNCDRIVNETMISMSGPGPLLANRSDMDDIVDAVTKVYENRDQLHKI